MSDLAEIILLIEVHHREHPKHGIDCACMDKFIGQVRKLTESKEAQSRVDYIIGAAIGGRR